MSRDYAKSSSTNRQKKRESRPSKRLSRGSRRSTSQKPLASAAAWLVLGSLLALFATGLVFLNHKHRHSNLAQETLNKTAQGKDEAIKPTKTTRRKVAKAASTPPQPQFDFYTILPKSLPPTNVNRETPSSTTTTAAQNPQKPAVTTYTLQVASLRQFEEADRLKAQLSLENFKVYILKTGLDDSALYKVNVGPFTDLIKAEDAQDKLRVKNINSLLIRATA